MIKFTSIGKIVFLEDFLTKGKLLPVYRNIGYKGRMLYKNKDWKDQFMKNSVVLVKDIPDYLSIDYSDSPHSIKLKKLNTQKGYLVDLSLFKNANEYFTKKFGPKSRSNLRRYENRLKHCFDISYVVYYGNITKDEYKRLFGELRNLLIRRFEQKKEKNYELQYLNDFENTVYDMVLDQNANMYVIYHKNKPISIRINMFKGNLAYYIISGYDIDYSKFHLGNIDMLKNIEWLFDRDFTSYDLLKGYYSYKKKWMTHSYNNQKHFIYHSSSLSSNFICHTIFTKELCLKTLLDVLKFFKIHIWYRKIKKRIANNKSANFYTKSKISPYKESATEFGKKIIPIDIENDNNYFFLRKAVYDFLFESKESYGDIQIYSDLERLNTFHIIGKNNARVLTQH